MRKDIYNMVNRIMQLKQEKKVMDKIVCMLSPTEVDLLVYRYVMNRNYLDICRTMKMGKSNYYNSIYRLLGKIKGLMEKT